MIEYVKGDILESQCTKRSSIPSIAGGKWVVGLALSFKRKFPAMFLVYKRDCDDGKVKVGKMHVWKGLPNGGLRDQFSDQGPLAGTHPRWEWIVLGLQDLVEVVRKRNIKSIAIPPLVAGLGGLKLVSGSGPKSSESMITIVRHQGSRI